MPICFLVLAVYLDLRDNRLTGTVPRELLELPNLRECSQATISYSLVAFTHKIKKTLVSYYRDAHSAQQQDFRHLFNQHDEYW